MELSEQQVISCAADPGHCGGTGGCDGSTQPLAFNYTSHAGLTSAKLYPYEGSSASCNPSKLKPVAINRGLVKLPPNNYSGTLLPEIPHKEALTTLIIQHKLSPPPLSLFFSTAGSGCKRPRGYLSRRWKYRMAALWRRDLWWWPARLRLRRGSQRAACGLRSRQG